MIAKSEYIPGKANPRFVVTSLDEQDADARRVYERLYCARWDAENRIREQLELFAGRMSTHWTRSNQVRLFLSGLAYLLMSLLRRVAGPGGLGGTAADNAAAEAAQDRCSGRGDLPARVASDVVELSVATRIPSRFPPVHRRLIRHRTRKTGSKLRDRR